MHLCPVTRHGHTWLPLSRRPGGLQAYKILLPVSQYRPEQRVHEGWDWVYVLSGQPRLVLGEHDLLLAPGEVAEFDTRTPHWFGHPGPETAEVLGLFGPQGERIHVRARSPRARPLVAGKSVLTDSSM